MQISPSGGRDFIVSKVVERGMQRGDFIPIPLHKVVAEEDPGAPFRTSPSDAGNWMPGGRIEWRKPRVDRAKLFEKLNNYGRELPAELGALIRPHSILRPDYG